MPWRPAVFKGTSVFARCDAQGEVTSGDGRVEIRYRVSDHRSYHASARNVDVVPGGEILPEAAPGPAVAARRRRTTLPQRRGARGPVEYVVAYADGACSGNPGPAGIGVVIVRGGKIRELSRYLGSGTNNIAELTAIEAALEEVGDPGAPVRIYSDSQYAIGVLSKGWKARANAELVERVRAALARFSDLEFEYVPGHAGVVLNERADALAVRAVSDRASTGWTDGDWPA
jgi:ribonuclease HI